MCVELGWAYVIVGKQEMYRKYVKGIGVTKIADWTEIA
jgi:hypothetical protein